MTKKTNTIEAIIKAIRSLSDDAKRFLGEADAYSYHAEINEILGMIIYNDDLGPIDWTTTSDELTDTNWHSAESLKGKSINDLRAIIYNHLRNERFSRGHIQSLAASGYLNQWADALEVSQ